MIGHTAVLLLQVWPLYSFLVRKLLYNINCKKFKHLRSRFYFFLRKNAKSTYFSINFIDSLALLVVCFAFLEEKICNSFQWRKNTKKIYSPLFNFAPQVRHLTILTKIV